MGAVLALSQVQGAYAVVTAVSTCGTPGDNVNSAPLGTGGACACVAGYSNVAPAAGAASPATATTATAIDCKYCAPGYYLKTASAATVAAGGVGAECAPIAVAILSNTEYAAANIGEDVKTINTPTVVGAGATCAADYYGAPTDYAGTGCNKCPANTAGATGATIAACLVEAGYYLSSPGTATTAGTVTKVPAGYFSAVSNTPVTSVTGPLVWDGTDAKLNGEVVGGVTYAHGVRKCPANSNSAAGAIASSGCKVNAGYYISSAEAGATLATISLAPANTYAPGGQAANAAAAAPTACPFAGTSPAGSSAQADCTPDCSTTNPDSNAIAYGGGCYCDVGAYNTNGVPTAAAGGEAAANGCTKCSTTFAAAGAGVTTSGYGGAAETDCETAPGYIITYPATLDITAVQKSQLTVEQAPAGYYATGGTSIIDDIDGDTNDDDSTYPEKASVCPTNSNSVAGSAFCTCDAGYVPAMGGIDACQPFDVSVTATATVAAESAGASTPIAVALAAAAAVPLLL